MPLSYEAKYGIMFVRKSHMTCIIDFEQIKSLECYRVALDHLMISMNSGKQSTRTKLLAESQRVIKFLNEFEM